MPITMKALKDFRGRPGEGNITGGDNRTVEAGPEFKVESQGRADWLEGRGFAIPVKTAAAKSPAKPAVRTAEVKPRENKAADVGPLASAGGRTGEVTPQSLSPPAQARRTPRSRKPAGGLDL